MKARTGTRDGDGDEDEDEYIFFGMDLYYVLNVIALILFFVNASRMFEDIVYDVVNDVF